MNRARLLPWGMLAVWATWIAATQGLLAAHSAMAHWVPDIVLLLLISCAGRFQARDVPWAALVLALARISFTVEPPAAVLAGFLSTAFLVREVAAALEVTGPLVRTIVAGAGTWFFSAWLVLVHAVRNSSSFDLDAVFGLAPELLALSRSAFTTALLAWALGPALAHLPGLTPLRKRRW